MARVTIQLNNGELDLQKDIGFGLQYSIDDIKNPTKRNSAHSKTIILAGSKNNNFLLGNLFDINSDFTFFNPNIKTDARIIVDSTTVIDGFLQLRNIKKLNNVDLQGNLIQYEVVVYDKSVDFFAEIGDKELTDLTFSGFNHTYNFDNITSSWDNTFDDIYTYPMMFKNSDDYFTNDFKAAIFHKAYLLQIAQEAGFSLGGTFIDSHTDYEKEIIPYNGTTPTLGETELSRRQFRAGLTSNQTLFDGTNTVGIFHHYWSRNQTGANVDNIQNYILTNDSTLPNFDNGNHWDTTLGEWTVDKNGKYNAFFNGTIRFEINATTLTSGQVGVGLVGTLPWSNPQLGTFPSDDLTSPLQRGATMDVKIIAYLNGVPLGVGAGQSFSLPSVLVDTTVYTFNINLASQILNQATLAVGDQVTFRIGFGTRENYGYGITTLPAFGGDGSGNPVDAWLAPYWAVHNIKVSNLTTSTIWNVPLTGNLTDGDNISVEDFVPANFKQKDLFVDLIKRYNLYIEIDQDNDKKILLHTREDYYNTGSTLDWTQKKDYSNEDKIELLSDLQNKEMLFTYKADKDIWNAAYQDSTKDVYGQKEIEFTNEFIEGENKVETPFSPTPLVYSSLNKARVVPAIDSQEPKNNIRVLYYGGMINPLTSQGWTFNYINSGGTSLTSGYTQYPYCGHFDSPTAPTLDLNYAETSWLYYNELISVTNNNLYRTYWSSYIDQISEGRLVTSKFNLSEVDIAFIKNNLNTKIFVKDSWYFINKIVDYDPTENKLTTVQLIKINEGVEFILQPSSGVVDEPLDDVYSDSEINGFVESPTSGGALGSTSTGYDSSNLSESSQTMVSGSNNRIGDTSNKTFITGDNNFIEQGVSNSGILGGNNNRIFAGTKNSWIIGSSGKTITHDNEIWLGDIHYIDGNNLNELFKYNLIDGGEDELRNLYSDAPYNLIDGGEDTIRNVGYTDIINLIDGGEDSL